MNQAAITLWGSGRKRRRTSDPFDRRREAPRRRCKAALKTGAVLAVLYVVGRLGSTPSIRGGAWRQGDEQALFQNMAPFAPAPPPPLPTTSVGGAAAMVAARNYNYVVAGDDHDVDPFAPEAQEHAADAAAVKWVALRDRAPRGGRARPRQRMRGDSGRRALHGDQH